MILFESLTPVGHFALIFAVLYMAMMLGLFLALWSGADIRYRWPRYEPAEPGRKYRRVQERVAP